MRHAPHIRESVRRKITALAEEMSRWDTKQRITEDDEKQLRSAITPYSHTPKLENLRIAGVDGSGDYPNFAYADSFVYVANASGTIFRTDPIHGLYEEAGLEEPTLELLWLPEDQSVACGRWLRALESLAGMPAREVIASSDYRPLKDAATRSAHTVETLLEDLILPRASDSSNVGIQLRSTAELGTALRLITGKTHCDLVLMDTTFSLPMVTRKGLSLFYEHLKRLCCVEARKRDIVFAALSKSHGLPGMDQLEALAADVLGIPSAKTAEHWYLRLPIPPQDKWQFPLVGDRQIPPEGAVTYLFRIHRNTPVMRLDIDYTLFRDKFSNSPAAEQRLFEQVDYTAHSIKSPGYPYPIKASHDLTRLSNTERENLKKQIIDAAAAAGMKRSLFRDVSSATGHV